MAQKRLSRMSDDEVFEDWTIWVAKVREDLYTLAWNRLIYARFRQFFSTIPTFKM